MLEGPCVFSTSVACEHARTYQALCICDHSSSHVLGHGPQDDAQRVHHTPPLLQGDHIRSTCHPFLITKGTWGEDMALVVLREPVQIFLSSSRLQLSELQKPEGHAHR